MSIPFDSHTRREFLWEAGGGFGGVALASMLTSDGLLAAEDSATTNPLASRAAAALDPVLWHYASVRSTSL